MHLTTYFGKLPSRRRSIISLLAMGFLFGLLTHFITPVEADSAYGLALGLLMRGADGLLLISVPAILSAFAITLIKRELSLQKSLFIALVSSFLYAFFYFIAKTGISPDVLFVGYGLVFVVWYVVARVFFNLHWYTAFTLSLIQLVFNAGFLFLGRMMVLSNDPATTVLKLYLSSLAFIFALYAVFWLIDAPMKRNFGVSGVEAASLFMAQWMVKSKGLEEMFQSVGEEVETLVSVMSLCRKGKECLFVVPAVHYGPFGNLGGSDFPHLLAERLGNGGREVFVFHGTATHDFNPVATEEISSLIDGCNRALSGMKLEKARGAFLIGKAGSSRALCLVANKNCFISLTRAPKTTEDMDFALGMSIRYLALSLGMDEAAVADAHNSETGEISRVYAGDPIGFEYLDSVKGALSKKFRYEPLKFGFSRDDLSGVSEGTTGKGGLKAAVFQAGDKLHGILLFDANGITPGFRRRLIEAAREREGVECEIYTTDTHSINTVSGVLNPIGNREGEEFVTRVLDAVELAKDDLSEFEVGMKTERVRIKVFGTQQSSELLGTINSIVAVARVAVPIVFLVTALFVLWGLTKIKV